MLGGHFKGPEKGRRVRGGEGGGDRLILSKVDGMGVLQGGGELQLFLFEGRLFNQVISAP